MKTTTRMMITLTLLTLANVSAIAAPPPWQLGRISRQLCLNLDVIVVGELKNISTLSGFKNQDIEADRAMSLIIQAQQYMQSNYVDTVHSLKIF
jgi:hypothetical protein